MSISDALLKISFAIHRVRASTDVVDVMAVCFLEMQKICARIHSMAIHRVVDESRNLFETYSIGASGTIASLQVRKASHFFRLYKSQEIGYFPCVEADYPIEEVKYFQSQFEDTRIESIVDVPFSSGVISTLSQVSKAFDTNDVEMLKQVAEVFSVGMRRVQDLEKIEARVEELVRFEKRYSLAVTAGKTGIWDYDLSSDKIFVDEGLWAMIGLDRKSCTVSMDEWTSHVYADDYPKLIDRAQDLFTGGVDDYEVEFRMLHADGTLRWFIGRGKAVHGKDGRATRLAGTNTDISDLKQMEKALQSARRDLELRVKVRTSELRAANRLLEEAQERMEAQLRRISGPTYT